MRNSFTRLKNKSGLTIVELLVSLFLVSLLMVFIVSSYLFVQRFIGNWKNEISIYQEAEFLMGAIEKDIPRYRSHQIQDTALFLTDDIRETVTYIVTHGNLIRNYKVLNSKEFTVQSLDFKSFYFARSNPDSIFVIGGYDYKRGLLLVRLTLQSKDMIDSFQTTVVLSDENFIS